MYTSSPRYLQKQTTTERQPAAKSSTTIYVIPVLDRHTLGHVVDFVYPD